MADEHATVRTSTAVGTARGSASGLEDGAHAHRAEPRS